MCDYHPVFESGNRCLKLHSADSDSTNMIKIISLSITNEAGTDYPSGTHALTPCLSEFPLLSLYISM